MSFAVGLWRPHWIREKQSFPLFWYFSNVWSFEMIEWRHVRSDGGWPFEYFIQRETLWSCFEANWQSNFHPKQVPRVHKSFKFEISSEFSFGRIFCKQGRKKMLLETLEHSGFFPADKPELFTPGFFSWEDSACWCPWNTDSVKLCTWLWSAAIQSALEWTALFKQPTRHLTNTAPPVPTVKTFRIHIYFQFTEMANKNAKRMCTFPML